MTEGQELRCRYPRLMSGCGAKETTPPFDQDHVSTEDVSEMVNIRADQT